VESNSLLDCATNRQVTLRTVSGDQIVMSYFVIMCVYVCVRACVRGNSTVGIATRYGLDRPRIESRWGRDLLHPSRPTQPSVQWVPGLLQGLKQPVIVLTTQPFVTSALKKEYHYFSAPPVGPHSMF
jgi:hypothetical protein